MNPRCSRKCYLALSWNLKRQYLDSKSVVSLSWRHSTALSSWPFQNDGVRDETRALLDYKPKALFHSSKIYPLAKKNNAYGISWRQIKPLLSPEAAALSEVLKIGQSHQKTWKYYCLPPQNQQTLSHHLGAQCWSLEHPEKRQWGTGKEQSCLLQVLSDETYLCKTV